MISLRRRRLETGMWAIGVLVSFGLTAWGLWLTAFLFGYSDGFERERSGHTLIFLGAVASAAAAGWARFRGLGWPGTLAVGATALLVGWTDLAAPDGLLPHLAGVIAVPATVIRLVVGLPAIRQGRGPQDRTP